MGGSVHEPYALANFQDGEERLVYARFKGSPDAPPYFLRDGMAEELRGWAKEHLECFMPKCADRRLTTVARSARRDGFRHLAGAGGHSRESLFHQQAKALIVRWLAETHPHVLANAEVATDSRTRRADVMVTFPEGRQVAIEVQYSSLSTREWVERHQSYLGQGITPVWLLGHLPPHLRTKAGAKDIAGEADEAVHLSDLQRTMTDAGVALLWISPIEERVGAAWVLTEHHAQYSVGPTAERAAELNGYRRPVLDLSKWGRFGSDPIRSCTLTVDGLVTPTSVAVRADYERYLAVVARHEEEDRVRAEQALAATQERVARQRAASEELGRTQVRAAPVAPPLPDGIRFTRCLACRTPLDPALSRTGYHILCGPRR